MTDHDPLDDLASAHLDGTTSPDEAAQVAADPALLARVETLRAVRAAVGAMPPVDPARRDAAITAALAAFDEAGRDEPSDRRSSVTSLTEVRARRGPPARMLRLVGAAAVVLLLAALVPLLAQLGGSHDDQAGDATSEAASGADGGREDDRSGAESADPTTTAADHGLLESAALGEYDSLDDLAAAVRGDRAPDHYVDSNDGENPRCASNFSSEAAAGAAELVGRRSASISGTPVQVFITSDADGNRRLRVYRVDDCALVGERPL
jgi:hypothetical protein